VCLLVMIGVRADGTKELVALSDGFRESSESWADLLRDCKRRGMTAPCSRSATGAGVLEGGPRRLFRRQGAALLVAQGRQRARRAPESAHPAAKKALAETYDAEDKAAAVKAAHTFAAGYGAKWKAVDQGGHQTGRHVGQRELPGQVRLLDGVGCTDGLRRAGWAGR
jgi:putative transposase